MALINDFESIHKDRQSVHRPTRCLYSVFDADGRRFLQLDTLGSDERQIREKVSQSIQFDAASAAKLLKVIRDAFPELG